MKSNRQREYWKTLKELSLFSGGGGGLIATALFMQIQTVGMVEFNEDCQKILIQRQKDGLMHKCPIFGDIKSFVSEGYAEAYKGMVDIITGGWPCQPYANSGLRKAQEDERNMWPTTKETIRIIQPKFLFLENVSTLLTFPYIQEIFGDLAQIGYNARWTVLPAKDIGAIHKRDRVWIFGQKNNSANN